MTIRYTMRMLMAPLLIGALTFTGSALAQITELCGTADNCTASRTIAAGEDATVLLMWRGTARVERPDRIISDAGQFVINDPFKGEILGMVTQPLIDQLESSADGSPVSFSIRESVRIPADVSRRAVAVGARRLYYTRVFSFYGMSVAATQMIPLRQPRQPVGEEPLRPDSEPAATAVSIDRVGLRFDSGSLVETVAKDGKLRAQATINYQRAGMLSAVWEVATPASGAQPAFRPLENVRRYLGAGNQVKIQSPLLPTQLTGVYSLRLRLVRPTINQPPVVIKYQVSAQSPTSRELPQVLPVTQPAAGQPLGPDTHFSWQAQRGAHAYRIELYDTPPAFQDGKPVPVGEPLTGMLTEGTRSEAQLSAAALSWLEPGKSYYWRVVAIATDGGIMAASPVREIQSQ